MPPAKSAMMPSTTTSETGSRAPLTSPMFPTLGTAADLSLGRAGIGRSIQASSRRGDDMTRWTLVLSAAVVATTVTAPATSILAATPKYYFQIQPVKAGPEVDADLKSFTAEAVKAELASRPEWASDIGPSGQAAPGSDRTALVSELKRRNLRGFDVTARIEK